MQVASACSAIEYRCCMQLLSLSCMPSTEFVELAALMKKGRGGTRDPVPLPMSTRLSVTAFNTGF